MRSGCSNTILTGCASVEGRGYASRRRYHKDQDAEVRFWRVLLEVTTVVVGR